LYKIMQLGVAITIAWALQSPAIAAGFDASLRAAAAGAPSSVVKVGHRDGYWRDRIYYGPQSYYYVPPVVYYPPPPVVYYAPPPATVVVPVPVPYPVIVRPSNCGRYHYWTGTYCADARYRRPYVGPRW
jgi:hypothetical protein